MTQPQKNLRLSTCHRHPTKPITGFCASCLRERLAGIDPDTHQETPATGLAAELRRSKSCSSSTNPNTSSTSTATTATTTTATEPRRRSYDVKSRSTLSDLFNIDDKSKNWSNLKSKMKNLEVKLNEEEEEYGFEIRVSENPIEKNLGVFEEEDENGEFRTMKEFIDLEWEKKKNEKKDFIRVSFWEAASLLSKRIGKWKLKEKKKSEKVTKDGIFNGGLMEKRKFMRETQSEIGEYGLFERRSCDTDPRLSVDVARLSVDDSISRYSFDEPRASWDGYLIGKAYPPLVPLVSVVEDVSLIGGDVVESVKENVGLKDEEGNNSPGGTMQTRDYYSERRMRRRSFDRSGSNRRIGLGDDEMKAISNAKVSPETVGLFHGAKLLVTEKELRNSNWYSLKECHAESVDSLSKDAGSAVDGGVSRKGSKFNKSQGWRRLWNIWGMMQRRSESKCRDEESGVGGNVINEQMAESWQKLSGVANGEPNGIVSQKLIRSYTISAKDSSKMASSTSGIEIGENGMKRREDLLLQRNRSARYSPNNLDHGLLRFYLTPMRSYGRSKSGMSRLKISQSVARNGL